MLRRNGRGQDGGRPAVAIRIFEQLLRLERGFEGIFELLLLAHGHNFRAEAAASKAAAAAAAAGGSEGGEALAAAPADTLESRVAASLRTGEGGDQHGAALDAAIAAPPISLQYNRRPPAPADHYSILGLNVDFSVRRRLRPFWRPFWLRFTYVTSVLVKQC
eukprot:COSAG01_NODE_389_length_17708_cov_111.404452_6_plen_162_part_00